MLSDDTFKNIRVYCQLQSSVQQYNVAQHLFLQGWHSSLIGASFCLDMTRTSPFKIEKITNFLILFDFDIAV